METIKAMIVYLEENQIRIDNEITDNKKAQEIFTKVDESLGIQDVRITNLRDKLAGIETQLNNQ